MEDLVNENSPVHNYEIVYQPSNDSRGLSVALLFDKEKYALIQFNTLKFQLDENEKFATRDILHTEFSFEEKKLHIFVCHLPSKREKDLQKAKRHYIIAKLRETIQHIVEQGEPVIVMGDFNENPDAEELQQLRLDNDGKKMLSNPFELLYLNRQFSSYHGKKGVGFDQILYTENMLLQQFSYQTISAAIYNSPNLRNKDRKHSNYPMRTYSGSRYMGGWSDHFPVVTKLTKN